MATKTDEISDGILKAQALYAAYLGKQQDHQKVDEDAAKKIELAKKKFEQVREAQLKTVADSMESVKASKQELIDFQNELRDKTGAIINLLDAPSGGRVRI